LSPELLVIGALNWDVNLFVHRLPKYGEEVVVERIDRVPGGKGGNVSVAAARILGPGHVALLACVGRDDVGRKQISILRDEGVETNGVQVLDRIESGQAYVTVDAKGTNVIETHFGANAELKHEHIMKQVVQELLASCSLMVVIDPPKQVAGKILAEGRRLKRSVIWHPGVLTRFGIKEFEDEMEALDYLVLNQVEASRFTKSRSLENSLASIGKHAPKARILVTLGGEGAAFYEKGKLWKAENVQLEKLGKKVVNTTGCGDAFVGAFAAYKILGRNDLEAIQYANMAGALKASRAETRGGPRRKELEDAYQKYFGT
jgi:ribokinase